MWRINIMPNYKNTAGHRFAVVIMARNGRDNAFLWCERKSTLKHHSRKGRQVFMSGNPHNAKNHLALALDNVETADDLAGLVESTKDSVGVFKIGLEQFIRFGPAILDTVRRPDTRLFLDLKLHDIPNTVAKAVSAASMHGVDLLTVHTTGGVEMMKAAVAEADAIRERGMKAPKLLGVTLLTSISADCLREELRVPFAAADQVNHLASLAVEAGMDGIVCSAADLQVLRPIIPDRFEVVTPGIRPAGAAVQDQKRVTTAGDAIAAGATIVVVGRPITLAESPGEAAREIVGEIVGKMSCLRRNQKSPLFD
ncbi:MAG: orotidine-5'-phosphate decarboxylase [Chitinivibrionales bacterium]|nr:orotidine-5'-phosphate decarboxylase [Chitinivibrionales bacterium]MBD3356828.1 orotidine-5'-phosphate decarboxylase [Chitinivibrionales bacterium]